MAFQCIQAAFYMNLSGLISQVLLAKVDLNTKHGTTGIIPWDGSSEKKYKCLYCNHSCNIAWNMDRHMRTHTGEKPFECPQCPLKFVTKFNLETHFKTHTGEKPHACHLCSYRAVQKVCLKQHLLRKHSVSID
ncbi:hypothetical protein SK128_004974 [Halocaridina rubra]|uniref:C2H2-type domain-containing protein n=1 Tax=Halocaridina rubra TaxID=373956 RepID=A0AAN8X6G2_HALRR